MSSKRLERKEDDTVASKPEPILRDGRRNSAASSAATTLEKLSLAS